jgi:hypothetical protein
VKSLRLEDFGIRNTTSPEERLAEYKSQCKGISQRLQAKFWLMVFEKDKEVAKLIGHMKPKQRGRPRNHQDESQTDGVTTIEKVLSEMNGSDGEDE